MGMGTDSPASAIPTIISIPTDAASDIQSLNLNADGECGRQQMKSRTPQGGVHKDDEDFVDDSIIPPLPEAGLQELEKETTSTTTNTSSGPVLWPSDSDITHTLPEEDDSQSEAELQEAKKETTTMESFECPLWLKRLAQKLSTGGNKQHNLRQIWGEKMPPLQPPPPTTAPWQPRSILKNSMTKSPVVNPNHLNGDASSRGTLNANIAFDELCLLMIAEQPFDKKCNSDVQRKLTRSRRKKSSYECLSGELPHQGSESFISTLSTPSTGTFQDAKKRQVPTLAKKKSALTQPQKNDSWGELDQSPKRNPRSSNHAFSLSANSSMLSAANISSLTNDAIGQVQVDLLPSTGSFMDASKRHVRTTSVPNQKWDRILLAGSSPNPLHLGTNNDTSYFKVPTKQSNHDQVVPGKERGDQLGDE